MDYIIKDIFKILKEGSPKKQLEKINNSYIVGYKNGESFEAQINGKVYFNLEPISSKPKKLKKQTRAFQTRYRYKDINNALNKRDKLYESQKDLYYLKVPKPVFDKCYGNEIKNLKALEILFEDKENIIAVNNELKNHIIQTDNIYKALVDFQSKVENFNELDDLEEIDDINDRIQSFSCDIYNLKK